MPQSRIFPLLLKDLIEVIIISGLGCIVTSKFANSEGVIIAIFIALFLSVMYYYFTKKDERDNNVVSADTVRSALVVAEVKPFLAGFGMIIYPFTLPLHLSLFMKVLVLLGYTVVELQLLFGARRLGAMMRKGEGMDLKG